MVFKSKGVTRCPKLERVGVDYDGKRIISPLEYWWVKAICFGACNGTCVYDNSAYVSKRGKNPRVVARNNMIFMLSKEGKTIKELRKMFKLSIRTIKSAIRGNDEH